MQHSDFRNYAVKHLGLNGLALDQYSAATSAAITSLLMPAEPMHSARQMPISLR